MKKKTKIIIGIVVILVCAVAIFIGITYANYKKSQNVTKPGEDYEQVYEDEKDIQEEIADVKVGDNTFSFTQLTNAKSLINQLTDVKTAKGEVTGSSVPMTEIESFTGGNLQKYFKGYSQMFPKKHKIAQGSTGYDFQIQNVEGLGEEVYLLATDENLYDKLPEGKESQIGDVPVKVFYTHNRRTNVENEKPVSTEQYMYEAVYVKEGIHYYYQMNFTGFNYEIDMVQTTKEDTSKRVAEKLVQLITQK